MKSPRYSQLHRLTVVYRLLHERRFGWTLSDLVAAVRRDWGTCCARTIHRDVMFLQELGEAEVRFCHCRDETVYRAIPSCRRSLFENQELAPPGFAWQFGVYDPAAPERVLQLGTPRHRSRFWMDFAVRQVHAQQGRGEVALTVQLVELTEMTEPASRGIDSALAIR